MAARARSEHSYARLFRAYPALKTFVLDYESTFGKRNEAIHAAAWALKELCVDPERGVYNGFALAAKAIVDDYLIRECGLKLDLDWVAPKLFDELNAGGDLEEIVKLLRS